MGGEENDENGKNIRVCGSVPECQKNYEFGFCVDPCEVEISVGFRLIFER